MYARKTHLKRTLYGRSLDGVWTEFRRSVDGVKDAQVYVEGRENRA